MTNLCPIWKKNVYFLTSNLAFESDIPLIRRLPHAWFSSYITNRKQYVKVGNTEFSLKTITCGVPQGSNAVSVVY